MVHHRIGHGPVETSLRQLPIVITTTLLPVQTLHLMAIHLQPEVIQVTGRPLLHLVRLLKPLRYILGCHSLLLLVRTVFLIQR